MKNTVRILSLLFALMLSTAPFAHAETFDLSNLSYTELVALKDQINLAIWKSKEWQEVTVPQGVWLVGEDIPAGHWTIKTKANNANIVLCTALDDTGKNVDVWKSDFYHSEYISSPDYKYFDRNSDKAEIDLDLKAGTYVIIDMGSVIFTPYAGKPSLGFK